MIAIKSVEEYTFANPQKQLMGAPVIPTTLFPVSMYL